MGASCAACQDGAQAASQTEAAESSVVREVEECQQEVRDLPPGKSTSSRSISREVTSSQDSQTTSTSFCDTLTMCETLTTEPSTTPPSHHVDSLSEHSLGPIGCGSWPDDGDLSEQMLRLKEDVLRLYRQKTGKDMTDFNLDYLTPATLQNYLVPKYAPDLLANACSHRTDMEKKLTGKEPIRLNGSCRIVGWDDEGRTIVALEPCTLQGGLAELLEPFEYVFWNAMDLNKPGAKGVVVIVDVGGGYNWKHFASMRALMEVVQLLKNCFHGQLAALYLVDMPSAFHGIYNAVAAFAEPDTRKRIKCLSGIEALVSALHEWGVEESIVDHFRSFMASRRCRKVLQTWNPIVDSAAFLERFPGLVAQVDLDTITAEHHQKFRAAILQFRIQNWGPSA